MINGYRIILTYLTFFIIQSIFSNSYAQSDPLRMKIGQMIIVGFQGTDLNDSGQSIDTLKRDISEFNLGGVVLFQSNVTSPDQIQNLTSQIESKASTPLFIAIDQEGGKVARLTLSNGFQKTKTAYELGSIFQSEDSVRAAASMMAGWLSESGINTNFAPVVDVDVNPNSPAIGHYGRSFSKYPADVSKYAGDFIDEFHNKNIFTTLKHFPGHGSAATDSHLGLTDITNTWADSELIPYRDLINEGKVDIIMSGHLFNSNLDSLYPATLSHNVITGLLREQLGYNGVVITDDMLMGAIVNYYSDNAVALAINAGDDILLFAGNLTTINTSATSTVSYYVNLIEKYVKDGVIPQNRIDESYERIMKLKQQLIPAGVDLMVNAEVPADYKLQNFPNPFNASTNFRFDVKSYGHIKLLIFNSLGQQVSTLMDDTKSPGTYNINWNAGNLPSGIYFATLVTSSKMVTQKIVLLK